MKITITLLSILYTTSLFAQIFIDQNANGSNDGSTWENAYTEFYTAIETSEDGDELWVAQGKYKVSSDGKGFIILTRNLKIYGGFNGTETSVTERDPDPLNTVITGDFLDNDIPDDFEINKEDNNPGLMSLLPSVTNKTIIDGLSFRNGFDKDHYGAALKIAGTPQIINCHFTQNFAMEGGALRINNFISIDSTSLYPFIKDCTFEKNEAIDGGAIFIKNSESVLLENNLFNQNTSTHNGGAVSIQESYTEWYNCQFTNNTAGLENEEEQDGGAIHCYSSNLKIDECLFIENQASKDGGAILCHSETPGYNIEIINSTFNNNSANNKGGAFAISPQTANINSTPNTLILTNNIFKNNATQVFGGALSIEFKTNSRINLCNFESNNSQEIAGAVYFASFEGNNIISNSTFKNNKSKSGGGIFGFGDGYASIFGCNFIGNESEIGGAIALASTIVSDLLISEISYSTFSENSADNYASSLSLKGTKNKIINNLFIKNKVNDPKGIGGTILILHTGYPEERTDIINSTMLDNSGELVSGIYNEGSTLINPIIILNSVFDNDGPNYFQAEDSFVLESLGGNISSDESLVTAQALDSDIHLTDPLLDENGRPLPTSPVIDFGIVNPEVPAFDILGNPRIGAPDSGAYEFTETVGTKEIQVSNHQISIAPNPVLSELNLSFDVNDQSEITLLIFNEIGQQISTKKLTLKESTYSVKVNVSYLPSGLYNCVLASQLGMLGSINFIKI